MKKILAATALAIASFSTHAADYLFVPSENKAINQIAQAATQRLYLPVVVKKLGSNGGVIVSVTYGYNRPSKSCLFSITAIATADEGGGVQRVFTDSPVTRMVHSESTPSDPACLEVFKRQMLIHLNAFDANVNGGNPA